MRSVWVAAIVVAGCLPVYSTVPPCGSPTDPANCGTCGHVCGKANTDSASCSEGHCVLQCTGAFAHCSIDDDGTGCETNLGTSTDNCGACGHSCGGGQCIAGQCQVVVLGGPPTVDHGVRIVYAMVAFGGYVYGTSWYSPGGLVFRLASSMIPSDPFEWIVGPGISGPGSGIATDGRRLFYAMYRPNVPHPQGIWSVDVDGTNDTQIVPGLTGALQSCAQTPLGAFADLAAVDETSIYFPRARDAGSPCPGIVKANRDGSDAALHLSGWRFTQVAVDTNSVYAINQTTQSIVSIDKALSSQTVLASQANPLVLRIDETHVYWIDDTGRHFHRVPKAGGTIEDVTPTNVTDGFHLAFLVDDRWIYFVTPPPNYAMPPVQQIQRTPKDKPGMASVMAKLTTDNVTALAQDGQAIYWATHGDAAMPPQWYSTVYKLAK